MLYGSLTVRSRAWVSPADQRLCRDAWWCECICGVGKRVAGRHLRGRRIQSCGCRRGHYIVANRAERARAKGGADELREHLPVLERRVRSITPAWWAEREDVLHQAVLEVLEWRADCADVRLRAGGGLKQNPAIDSRYGSDHIAYRIACGLEGFEVSAY